MLYDETAEPKALPLSLLAEITDGFSDEQQIGRGGFAVVYRGILKNGKVAVKWLSNSLMDDKEFLQEVECLMTVKHKNVVRFLGYCADTQGSMELYKGKFVMADVRQRLLCFEYLSKGSLDQYITDASCGLDWRNRYKIIKGISQGLHYLHQKYILHLDLKPANILLDGNYVPKIADFGLSRLFHENQSRDITTNLRGTLGYLPPEFLNGEITYLIDHFSLGVIVTELLTGKKGYHEVDKVVESWSNKLEESQSDIQLEQIRVCAEIGIKCTDSNPAKRPQSTQYIIDRLDKTKCMGGYIEDGRITSQQTSFVCELLKASSTAVSAKSPDQLRRMNTEDFSFPGSSTLVPDGPMSEHMPVAIFTAVTKIGLILRDALPPIIAKLSEKVASLKKLPIKVEQIRKHLIIMSDVIRQIGTVYLKDEAVKIWIGQVRAVAYHVEDVMDKYSYHVIQIEKEEFLKKYLIRGTHYVKVFIEIADQMVAVEETLREMNGQWLQSRFQLVPNKLIEMERQRSQDSFPEFVKAEDLVGIEENRKLLTGWLYSKEPKTTVITVSGMGGLGKSTLVSNVYERENINFPAHAWIVVSQIYTVDALLRKLLRKIRYIEQSSSARIDKMDVHDLKKEIQQRLEYKKCLIVLDDVWEQDIYFKMHDAFLNLQGSRIVITTRKNHVARISSRTRHLKLQPLSKHDAFELFRRRVFYNQKGHTCPKNLDMIATAIVHRYQCLPLAIVKIGSMLSSRQGLQIWAQNYSQFQSELSNDDHVRSILSLSYHELSYDLQICFLYCSLFPEDHPMSCDSLVRLWVAEGFVLPKERKTPEAVGEDNLMELIHCNMLEVVESDDLGRVKTCKMHAIMRELAISMAKDERFASANDHRTMILMDKDVRRLSLCGWRDNIPLQPKLQCLRTIVAVGVISYSPGMLSSILSESSYLTVLELQDSEIAEVPASIGSLFNLCYIGLRRTKVKSLPDSIEKLSNLQTLDIKQTKIEKLPRGIFKIKKLRHLLADRYDDELQTEFPGFIGVQAPKNLSSLEELQTLETVNSSNDLAEKLNKMMQLRSVWIDNISAAECANLFAGLSTMPLLSSLLLSARDENEALSFEELKPMSEDLHRLIIRGQWAKGTLNCPIFRGHGINLKFLDLSWCDIAEDPLRMLAPHLPKLTYLRLSNMRCANNLVASAGSFPHLTTLFLKSMPDVTEISIINGGLPCIEGLYIVSLSKLDKVPEGIESLRGLRRLWLLGLHKNFRSQWDTNGMHQKILHVQEVRL